MRVRSDVYSYDLEWEYDEPLSVQVLETDEATILFGGGTEATADDLVDVATDHDVDVVLVEHGDFDHYGGVPALRAAIDGLEVAVPRVDAAVLEDEGIPVDRPLDANKTYWGVETIASPGHTAENMSYRHKDVLVAGDTVVGANSPFAAAGGWSGAFAVITPEYNADHEQTKASVAELLDYDFEAVLVSHGENVESGDREEIETLTAEFE